MTTNKNTQPSGLKEYMLQLHSTRLRSTMFNNAVPWLDEAVVELVDEDEGDDEGEDDGEDEGEEEEPETKKTSKTKDKKKDKKKDTKKKKKSKRTKDSSSSDSTGDSDDAQSKKRQTKKARLAETIAIAVAQAIRAQAVPPVPAMLDYAKGQKATDQEEKETKESKKQRKKAARLEEEKKEKKRQRRQKKADLKKNNDDAFVLKYANAQMAREETSFQAKLATEHMNTVAAVRMQELHAKGEYALRLAAQPGVVFTASEFGQLVNPQALLATQGQAAGDEQTRLLMDKTQ